MKQRIPVILGLMVILIIISFVRFRYMDVSLECDEGGQVCRTIHIARHTTLST